jgi:hypothetical protein
MIGVVDVVGTRCAGETAWRVPVTLVHDLNNWIQVSNAVRLA